MNKTDRVEATIESDLKQAAEAIFSKLGVSPSETIRIFYKQVELHQGFPFEVKIPNAETLAANKSVDGMFEDWDTDTEKC